MHLHATGRNKDLQPVLRFTDSVIDRQATVPLARSKGCHYESVRRAVKLLCLGSRDLFQIKLKCDLLFLQHCFSNLSCALRSFSRSVKYLCGPSSWGPGPGLSRQCSLCLLCTDSRGTALCLQSGSVEFIHRCGDAVVCKTS